jgi:hypothetical protein
VTGNTYISSFLGIGTTTPKGILSVVTPTSTGNTTTAWTSAYVVVGTGAGSTTGKAIGLGFNTTTDQAEILALAPTTSWHPLNLFSNGVIFSSTAGAEAARLNSSGVLLLGETSSTPTGGGTFRLGIAGNIKFDSGGVIEFPTSGGNAWYFYDSSGVLIFQRGGVEAARFDTSGNLGIGMTPVAPLDITSTASTLVGMNSTNASGVAVAWRNSGSPLGFIGSAKAMVTGGALNDFAINMGNSNNLIISVNQGEVARFDTSGHLLIGTTTSTSVLSVSSSSSLIGFFTSTSVNGAYSIWANSGTQNGVVGSAKGLFSGTLSNFGIRAENNLIFGIGSNEYARIGSDGSFLVGTTTNAGAGCITASGTITGKTIVGTDTNSASFTGAGSTSSAAGVGMYVMSSGSGVNASGALFAFHRAGNFAINMGLDTDNILRIGGWSASASRWTLDTGSGNMTAAGTITASSSDIRLKENIVVIDNAIDKVKQLRGVYFDWKPIVDSLGFKPDDRHDIGVIAQEVAAVIPQAVKPAPFDHGEHGESISGENYITVQPEKIIPLLIEVAKEQQVLIANLTTRLAALEAK